LIAPPAGSGKALLREGLFLGRKMTECPFRRTILSPLRGCYPVWQ